ncbi:hypothetical protein AB6A40_010099, partial [Gnathostoma spinigerum]
PWGDHKAIELLARQLDVDVMVTGHTHVCETLQSEGRFYVNPGSITGAMSPLNIEPIPSFALLDVQSNALVTYLYRLIDNQVKVDRVQFTKNTAAS